MKSFHLGVKRDPSHPPLSFLYDIYYMHLGCPIIEQSTSGRLSEGRNTTLSLLGHRRIGSMESPVFIKIPSPSSSSSIFRTLFLRGFLQLMILTSCTIIIIKFSNAVIRSRRSINSTKRKQKKFYIMYHLFRRHDTF